jgi:predicted unusual protein kinase regulating ubiquinone biosynthesis (AarF/ABC1/UbiB family)
MSHQKPPTGGNRFLKLAGMTASVAGDYARSRIKRLVQSEEQARAAQQEQLQRMGTQIADTLGELKGAAMKLGQMASLAADLLPKELAKPLQSLQKEAPPVAFSVIEEQIGSEFDQPLERLFEHFEREPFAAASIGQVHRARVDGQEVICKVQYPGVDAAIDSDMRHLKLTLLASGMLRVDKKSLDAVFREISLRMHEELDYCNESDNVRAFRAFHRRHPFVQVPEVIGHRSAKRVLTLAYLEGDSLGELDELGYSPEERDRCGENLWRAMESQIYDYGTLHADPNPANFAFRRDGTVIIYDFGCVKQLAPGIAEGYEQLARHALAEDYRSVEQTLRALGVRRDSGREVPEAFYKLWRDWLAQPILASDPFDFGSARFGQTAISTLAPESLKYVGAFQPSSEVVFLNRTLGGHYAILRNMRARIPVKSLLRARFPGIAIPDSAD